MLMRDSLGEATITVTRGKQTEALHRHRRSPAPKRVQPQVAGADALTGPCRLPSHTVLPARLATVIGDRLGLSRSAVLAGRAAVLTPHHPGTFWGGDAHVPHVVLHIGATAPAPPSAGGPKVSVGHRRAPGLPPHPPTFHNPRPTSTAPLYHENGVEKPKILPQRSSWKCAFRKAGSSTESQKECPVQFQGDCRLSVPEATSLPQVHTHVHPATGLRVASGAARGRPQMCHCSGPAPQTPPCLQEPPELEQPQLIRPRARGDLPCQTLLARCLKGPGSCPSGHTGVSTW